MRYNCRYHFCSEDLYVHYAMEIDGKWVEVSLPEYKSDMIMRPVFMKIQNACYERDGEIRSFKEARIKFSKTEAMEFQAISLEYPPVNLFGPFSVLRGFANI
jgi:hypothetical protein